MKAIIISRELHRRFKEKYGTCRCYDMQTKFFGRFFNALDPADGEAAMKAGIMETCSGVTAEIARIAAELILEQQDKDAAKQAAA